MNRRRRVVAACAAVLALGALSSCSSQPGNRRVVRDVIESLRLPVAQEECMLERLEGYTDDQLDAIADENENWDPSGSGSTLAEASEGMRLFIDDFEECSTEQAAASSSGSTVPSETSEAIEETDTPGSSPAN